MDEILKDVVLFGGSWCVNCKKAAELLDKEGTEYTYIDVDSPAGKELAEDWKVRGLPVAFYKGRAVFNNIEGARRWIQKRKEELAAGNVLDVAEAVAEERVMGVDDLLFGKNEYAPVARAQANNMLVVDDREVYREFFGPEDDEEDAI